MIQNPRQNLDRYQNLCHADSRLKSLISFRILLQIELNKYDSHIIIATKCAQFGSFGSSFLEHFTVIVCTCKFWERIRLTSPTQSYGNLSTCAL